MSRINYLKMYRELYARELHKVPWRNIVMNSLFVLGGIGLSFVVHSEVAANGCLQVRGGSCITAASDPFQYYLYTTWFFVFALLGIIGLISSIRALQKKRTQDKTRNV